jgi:hypothetical protein
VFVRKYPIAVIAGSVSFDSAQDRFYNEAIHCWGDCFGKKRLAMKFPDMFYLKSNYTEEPPP